MTALNPELVLTLDDSVDEVLGMLTGLDLTYSPELDRYRAIARQLNRALRSNALEHEWSYYSTQVSVGTAVEGLETLFFDDDVRPRSVGDDAVRLVDDAGIVRVWAYILPRDAIHKYQYRDGLWCAYTRNSVEFSRPLTKGMEGLDIQVPMMREPVMFRLPELPDDPDVAPSPIDPDVREQPLDFPYPDVITLRAAFYVAQSDPVMQPRAQTIEAQYKDLMYQIIERDDRNTDSPYLNEFFVPVSNGIVGGGMAHPHPHSDERRY